jgi:hypothetical protein
LRNNNKLVNGLTVLIALFWTNGAMGASTNKVMSVTGLGFKPISTSQAYAAGGICLYPEGGGYTFHYPVNLPDGSTIKQIELTYIDNDDTWDSSLLLRKTETTQTNNMNTTTIVEVNEKTISSTLIQSQKSIEISELIDNSKYFYHLSWGGGPGYLVLCGARVYYSPPNSGTYLPLIKKD